MQPCEALAVDKLQTLGGGGRIEERSFLCIMLMYVVIYKNGTYTSIIILTFPCPLLLHSPWLHSCLEQHGRSFQRAVGREGGREGEREGGNKGEREGGGRERRGEGGEGEGEEGGGREGGREGGTSTHMYSTHT